MHLLVTGAAGMVGRKLLARVAADPEVLGAPVTELTLTDVVAPVPPPALAGITRVVVGDLGEPGFAASLVGPDVPDLVYHLAAVVSGEAEANVDLGYRANLAGTTALLDALRRTGPEAGRPAARVVYTSSIAVFGPPFPDRLDDTQAPAPRTSYGTQKAMGELLLADYSRRGFVDGVGIRLPTIVVRPGAANKAASGFFSGILREPLNGLPAVLPVSPEVRHWFASPRAAVGFLVHAATLDTTPLGQRRTLNMPGLSATVAEELEALRGFAGADAVRLVRHEPDEVVARIVSGWIERLDASRAESLGFRAERSFDEILRVYVEDDLAPSG